MNDLLIDAVIRQLGDRQTLRDVLRFGADAGFEGFTDDEDTREFFEANRPEIVALCRAHADDNGQDVVSFVAKLGALSDEADDDEIDRAIRGELDGKDNQVARMLSQFALAEVARYLFDRW